MRQAKLSDLQAAIVEDLKESEKTNEELCRKYELSYIHVIRIMDGLGSIYPIYNPRPGVWAILGYEK